MQTYILSIHELWYKTLRETNFIYRFDEITNISNIIYTQDSNKKKIYQVYGYKKELLTATVRL